MNMIPIDNIVVGKRLRQVRPEAVESLAQSIRELGLLNPVLVTPAPEDSSRKTDLFRLIAGNHRLEACKRLGMSEIATNIVTTQEVDQRLAEIDENLCRAELTHLERAEHLAERKSLYEMKHPETRHGGAPGMSGGGKKAKDELISSFAQDTAEKTGSTERSIQKAVRRANNISQEVRDAIRDVASISDNSLELDALASLEESQQKAAVQAVLDGKARSVREIIRQKEETSHHPAAQEQRSKEEPENDDAQVEASSVPGDLQDWKRKAKEASGQVLAQKDRIRTLNKERAVLKARIKELESQSSEPSPTSSTDLLDKIEAWQQRALQAEEESINLQHRIEEIKLGGSSGPINRGAALCDLLDDLETGLRLRPEDFQPETLNGFRNRFLRLVSAVEEALRRINQPILLNGE